MDLQGLTVGFAVSGSFCTMENAMKQAEVLTSHGINLIPIMSTISANTDTRFGSADYFKNKLREITGNEIILSIKDAEPIGPKQLLDALVVIPCTGNTMAKIANGIIDSPVVMSAKSHLRNNRPLILAIASNDALGANAKNLGLLLNTKNVYFVPFTQDDPYKKQNSLIADFDKTYDTLKSAMESKQLQPILSK